MKVGILFFCGGGGGNVSKDSLRHKAKDSDPFPLWWLKVQEAGADETWGASVLTRWHFTFLETEVRMALYPQVHCSDESGRQRLPPAPAGPLPDGVPQSEHWSKA